MRRRARTRACHSSAAGCASVRRRPQADGTLHRRPDAGTVLYAKGAPEVLLPRCRDADAATVQREIERLAAGGQRVLVFAARDDVAPGRLDAALEDLRLLGLQADDDPPRPEALEAVAACRRAQVRVLMITGDHPVTARAIGTALGMADRPAVTGAELESLDDDALRTQVRSADVYARVAPEHKLRLVRSLQADGAVVAMTGDGVNDAPAVRQADIGVAMGRGGTAAAKEAADMVLADDNFATLRAAIEEGRRVYDNLVKALTFVRPATSPSRAPRRPARIDIQAVAWATAGALLILPVTAVEERWRVRA